MHWRPETSEPIRSLKCIMMLFSISIALCFFEQIKLEQVNIELNTPICDLSVPLHFVFHQMVSQLWTHSIDMCEAPQAYTPRLGMKTRLLSPKASASAGGELPAASGYCAKSKTYTSFSYGEVSISFLVRRPSVV